MELIECPHCRTRVFASGDGECPACRKALDAIVGGGDAPPGGPPAPGAKLETVARFIDPIEASLAKNCLEEAGIVAFLADIETVSVAWQLGNALGGIKLQVASPDADRARVVLQDHRDGTEGEASELMREAIASGAGPVEGSPIEDDGPDEPEREPTEREKAADRAFRGAVFGLMFLPLQFYVTYLLLKVLSSSELLEGRPRRRVWIAAMINLTCATLLGGLVVAIAAS